MKALKYNQYVYELMNGDHVVDDDEKTLIERQTLQYLNVDISHVIHSLVDLREELEAAGYRIEGKLSISGPLNVTIDL